MAGRANVAGDLTPSTPADGSGRRSGAPVSRGSTPAASWGGRPVARCVADARPRRRAVLTGRLTGSRCRVEGLELVLDDGTGSIALFFLGRRGVVGLTPGALVTVEGTVLDRHGRRTILNPYYEVSTSW